MRAAVRVNPGNELEVSHMLPHPSLPLIALVYGNANLVQVYRLDEQAMLPSGHEPGFKLHGTFISGRPKHLNSSKYVPSRRILDAQWVGNLD